MLDHEKRLPTLESTPQADVLSLQRWNKRDVCTPASFRPRWTEPSTDYTGSASSPEWKTAVAELEPLVGRYTYSTVPAFSFWLMIVIATVVVEVALKKKGP